MSELVETGGLSPAEAERHALAAVEAVERVDSPEEAESLLRKITAYQQAVRLAKIGHEQERRWAAIRLQAERKMGELLGPATPGRNPGESDRQSDSDYKQAERARKLAAVPEDAFTEYLETAEEPTRAGLLRTYAPPKPSPEPPLAATSRRVHQQLVLVTSLANQAKAIAMAEPHLDVEAIRSISEEEKEQWKQQLCDARTVLSRVIGAL